MLQSVESSRDGRKLPVLPGYRDKDVILFEEGLVGFPGCKRFVLMEGEEVAPFRILQCLDQQSVGFLVLDPTMVVKTYNRAIPSDAWRSLDLTDTHERLSLVICILGKSVAESTANLQAPLLINYKKMRGIQLILTTMRFSVTQPLLPSRSLPDRRRVAAGARPN